ncbi:hypothetical protein EDD29_6018 [Actinocorallia herbida]|uniref:Uncharacterized protein n=1 Tax=Actinocorallia herbida TaxID=58109 RepID=A0A3N1D494_9ACTN|nr:DUF6221 family protein [Actinocorallia herbida]ROO88352.1 hypothetical protein EDD29_6018 [Actinocorallia herbida]
MSVEDLVRFLKERLDRDEAVARACAGAPWTVGAGGTVRVSPTDAAARPDWERLGFVARAENASYAEHIARMNPQRALSTVAAHRSIVETYEKYTLKGPQAPELGLIGPLLRTLAAQYSTHPAYRSEWAL